ncbi:hypothetical protein [Streptacidiphilus carbonis]|jgi:uncharacterized protein HemX|uniref:hypothetical protein n=1 Tax=Streptacidiphilus carbonis TaxID=105422 RepID=UPI0005AB6571|nr:hypothetical protein [Streptacidiphilus carbonis]
MADYQNPPVEDPSASTQMFRAFVDDPQPKPATAASESSRTGVIAVGVIVVLAIIAGVVFLAAK